MEKIYLETTIFSFYFDERPQPEIVARRNWSRQLWLESRSQFNFVTSTAVLRELQRGQMPHRFDAFDLAKSLPAMEPDDVVDEVVRVYLKHKLMPLDPAGDVLHLALASVNKCDYLVTWNCGHLANANKGAHIRRINALLGLPTPSLVTPLEILGTEAD